MMLKVYSKQDQGLERVIGMQARALPGQSNSCIACPKTSETLGTLICKFVATPVVKSCPNNCCDLLLLNEGDGHSPSPQVTSLLTMGAAEICRAP